MTGLKFVGTVLVIAFSAYYAFVRRAEMEAKIQQECAELKKILDEKMDEPMIEETEGQVGRRYV
jgi:hypothetical protein